MPDERWPTPPVKLPRAGVTQAIDTASGLDQHARKRMRSIVIDRLAKMLALAGLVAVSLLPSLAEPASVSGFTLQSTSNPASATRQKVNGPVTGVGTEHTVSVSTAGGPRFVRLRK